MFYTVKYIRNFVDTIIRSSFMVIVSQIMEWKTTLLLLIESPCQSLLTCFGGAFMSYRRLFTDCYLAKSIYTRLVIHNL